MEDEEELEKQQKRLQQKIRKMAQSKEDVERMKELCKERNNIYEKQGDLKGRKWEIEKSLER